MFTEHLTADITEAAHRVRHNQAAVYVARAELAEHGEATDKPTQPMLAAVFAMVGLAIVYGVALYELMVRLYVDNAMKGYLMALGLAFFIAGASITAILEAGKHERGKAWATAAALIGAAALFALRVHLADGNLLIAAGWSGLDLLIMLAFEGAAMGWSDSLKRWQADAGPRSAAEQRVVQAKRNLHDARARYAELEQRRTLERHSWPAEMPQTTHTFTLRSSLMPWGTDDPVAQSK